MSDEDTQPIPTRPFLEGAPRVVRCDAQSRFERGMRHMAAVFYTIVIVAVLGSWLYEWIVS